MWKKVDNVNHVGSGPASAAEAVIDLVHTVMHQFRSTQYQVLRDNAHDVTHMESKVMAFFARHAGATLSDLVAHSGRDKAQLARLVRGLRDKGLLEGEVNEGDRRRELLRPTAAGLALFRAVNDEGTRLASVALAGLSDAECRQLADLLGRVRANLDGEG